MPYPPPAARSEEVGPAPSLTAVWVDGYWHWNGKQYEWRTGAWVELPEGRGYAPPEVVRLQSGALVWYPPRWKPLPEGP